jgi:hypothetical protein
MFRIPRSQPWPPAIDLHTVRETVLYMRDDAKRIPGLEGLTKAFDAALVEIEKAERKARPPILSPIASKFLPRRPF